LSQNGYGSPKRKFFFLQRAQPNPFNKSVADMCLCVLLASGAPVPVDTQPRSQTVDLRKEVGERLGRDVAVVGLSAGGRLLEDHDEVPDGTAISVLLYHLPWLDDGSGRILDAGDGAFAVTGEAMARDVMFNALCDAAFSGGQQYFEVEVLQGDGAWIGVGTKADFGAGYRVKGVFFGGPGNITDGGRLVRKQFGTHVESGDVIGVDLDLSDPGCLTVAFHQNGKYLGVATSGRTREEPGSPLFPLVSAKQAGDRFRLSLRRRLRPPPPPPHPAIGKWRLQRILEGAVDVDVQQATGGVPVVLDVQKYPGKAGKFRLCIEACSITCFMEVVPQANSGDTLRIFQPMSPPTTLPVALMSLQRKLGTALPLMTAWQGSGAGTGIGSLQFAGVAPDGTGIQLAFAPAV